MHKIIKSTKNEFVKNAKSLRTKKGRKEHGSFLAEGKKCVDELIAHMPGILQSIIVVEDKYSDLITKAQKMDKQIYYTADHVMNAICESKTPQGIAAIAKIPEQKTVYNGFILLLDDVQDPQNIGTMIRTADAAGCSCVILSDSSADCFSPKAVRASMGSIFHIPVIRTDIAAYIKELISSDYQIACAHVGGAEKYSFDWEKTCLVIGNESRGVSEQIQKMSTKNIKIPMYGKAQSLNAAVAAGILLYKIRT